jgi:hypothetical protein
MFQQPETRIFYSARGFLDFLRQDILGTIYATINEQIADLRKIAMHAIDLFRTELPESWNYITDPITGIEILNVEKDPMALDKAKKIMEKLFE